MRSPTPLNTCNYPDRPARKTPTTCKPLSMCGYPDRSVRKKKPTTCNQPDRSVRKKADDAEKTDDNPSARAHMCTNSPPDPPREAPPTPWLKVGWCTGTQAAQTATRNAASAGDRVAWAPTLNLGCGVTSLTKLHRFFRTYWSPVSGSSPP